MTVPIHTQHTSHSQHYVHAYRTPRGRALRYLLLAVSWSVLAWCIVSILHILGSF